jgi:hypothetical protein
VGNPGCCDMSAQTLDPVAQESAGSGGWAWVL